MLKLRAPAGLTVPAPVITPSAGTVKLIAFAFVPSGATRASRLKFWIDVSGLDAAFPANADNAPNLDPRSKFANLVPAVRSSRHLSVAKQHPERIKELIGPGGYASLEKLIHQSLAASEMPKLDRATDYKKFVARHRLALSPTTLSRHHSSQPWKRKMRARASRAS
jgi:hypothetical protein